VGITLASDQPMIEAVNVDKHLSGPPGRATRAAPANTRGGGNIGSPAEGVQVPHGHRQAQPHQEGEGHDGVTGKVTLTALQRSLKDDTGTIPTMLKRVRELVGDRAKEVCRMKSNDRNSYGTLLLHPSKK
jgi:hypothetical protein